MSQDKLMGIIVSAMNSIKYNGESEKRITTFGEDRETIVCDIIRNDGELEDDIPFYAIVTSRQGTKYLIPAQKSDAKFHEDCVVEFTHNIGFLQSSIFGALHG